MQSEGPSSQHPETMQQSEEQFEDAPAKRYGSPRGGDGYADDSAKSGGRDSSPPPSGSLPESGKGSTGNNQVFVGSISYDSSEQDLRDFFADCGTVVDVRIPVHSDSGRPRGIAFVEFSDDEGANRAIRKDGAELQGRCLKINIASSRGGGRGGGHGGRPGSSDRPEGCRTIFVGNLSWGTDENALGSVFDRCGRVQSVRVISDRDTGRSRGFGYVEFDSEDAVDAALRLSGTDVDGRSIRVDFAADRNRGGGGGRDSRPSGYGRDDRGGYGGRDSGRGDYGGRRDDYGSSRRDDYRRDDYGSSRRDDYGSSRRDEYSSSRRDDYGRGDSGRDRGRDYGRSDRRDRERDY